MKSFQVVDFNAPLKEVDQPTPQPSGTQVLIKVKAAGVCHSDLHIWEGGYDLGHGRKPLSLKDRGVSLPRTMDWTFWPLFSAKTRITVTWPLPAESRLTWWDVAPTRL